MTVRELREKLEEMEELNDHVEVRVGGKDIDVTIIDVGLMDLGNDRYVVLRGRDEYDQAFEEVT